MKKHFVGVNAISIAYVEINPSGANTIFFIHGNSGSSNAWRKQLNNETFSPWRLVAFDLPSHGESSLLENAAECNLPALGEVMTFAINILADSKPYIIAGMSLGTNVVAEMLAFDLHPKGIVLAGPCIVGENISIENFAKTDTHVEVVFMEDPPIEVVRLYATETSLSPESEDHEAFEKGYTTTDKKFRKFLTASIGEKNYSDQVKLINQMNVPAMVVFGEDEKIVHNTYLDNTPLPLWRNKIFIIPAASHLVNIDQPGAFNKLLAEFMQDIFD